jgi:cysteine protease ATG4
MENIQKYLDSASKSFENDDNVGDEELVQISSIRVQNITSMISVDGFDICKEYGYRYEYTEDDEDGINDEDELHGNKLVPSIFTRLVKSDASDDHSSQDAFINNPKYEIFCLGKKFHPINDYHSKREYESNLFWCTYRCDFEEIKPYGITSDAGWGCMLRSAQMLIAQALRIHYCGRDWKAPQAITKRRQDLFIQDLMMWLADYPSSDSGSWYSIHNMVAAGLAKYDVLPGEWFGPGTSCYVIRDLSVLHEKDWILKHHNQTLLRPKEYDFAENGYCRHQPLFKVYVASEGTIYISDIQDLVANVQKQKFRDHDIKLKKDSNTLLHPLSDTLHPKASKSEAFSSLKWEQSLLVLIPLRLGLKTFNTKYSRSLAYILSLPQSVGILGGSPRHALWFYGASSDGSKVFGLDPHTVQRAPCRQQINADEVIEGRNKRRHQVLLTDEYLRSINCPYVSSMDMAKIDPSLALGFYIRDSQDFEEFCNNITNMTHPELFALAIERPDYTADLDMMDLVNASDENGVASDTVIDACDEDDYIMI